MGGEGKNRTPELRAAEPVVVATNRVGHFRIGLKLRGLRVLRTIPPNSVQTSSRVEESEHAHRQTDRTDRWMDEHGVYNTFFISMYAECENAPKNTYTSAMRQFSTICSVLRLLSLCCYL